MFHIHKLVFALAFVLVSFEATQACQICMAFPKKSAADYLFAAHTVILAREEAFAYKPIEVLKGTKPEAKINLLVDSSTRRMLTANPRNSVLLVKLPDHNHHQNWMRLGVINPEIDPILRKVLSSASQWKADPLSRITYFTGLLKHHNSQIWTMAYLEVGRAPYSEIRRIAKVLPREQIRAFLKERRYIEWHPLYILLLAQEPEDEDRATIVRSFRTASRFGLTTGLLAAWSTAYIEITGEQAIDDIEKAFFKDQTRTPEVLQEVTKALSVHGTYGNAQLRDRIVASYQTLISVHPEMICSISSDLIAWKRTELADANSKHLASNHEENHKEVDGHSAPHQDDHH